MNLLTMNYLTFIELIQCIHINQTYIKSIGD